MFGDFRDILAGAALALLVLAAIMALADWHVRRSRRRP